MVVECLVKSCPVKMTDKSFKLYKIPAIDPKARELAREKGEKRQRLWKKACGVPEDDVVTRYHKVCSRHFVTGKPAPSSDYKNVDWVPTRNLGIVPDSHGRKKQNVLPTATLLARPEPASCNNSHGTAPLNSAGGSHQAPVGSTPGGQNADWWTSNAAVFEVLASGASLYAEGTEPRPVATSPATNKANTDGVVCTPDIMFMNPEEQPSSVTAGRAYATGAAAPKQVVPARIDFHTATQQVTVRLPNRKLIQVSKQVTNVPRRNVPIAPKPTTVVYNPASIAQNAIQQQQQLQEQRRQQQMLQQQRQQQQPQPQVTIQPGQPQPTIVAEQTNPALQLLQGMFNGPHEDSPLGRSRKNFEGKLLSGVEICQQFVNKIITLTKANSFKNIRNVRDLKELYIHVSYLLTYAIGQFKTLQEKCVEDVKKMGFTKESDFVMMGEKISNRNPEEDKSDDEDGCEIIEQNTTLIEIDSEGEVETEAADNDAGNASGEPMSMEDFLQVSINEAEKMEEAAVSTAVSSTENAAADALNIMETMAESLPTVDSVASEIIPLTDSTNTHEPASDETPAEPKPSEVSKDPSALELEVPSSSILFPQIEDSFQMVQEIFAVTSDVVDAEQEDEKATEKEQTKISYGEDAEMTEAATPSSNIVADGEQMKVAGWSTTPVTSEEALEAPAGTAGRTKPDSDEGLEEIVWAENFFSQEVALDGAVESIESSFEVTNDFFNGDF